MRIVLCLLSLIFSWSCRADQGERKEPIAASSDELKLCLSQSAEQMTCIYSKHDHWTLSLSFPQNQLFLNNQVELRQTDECRFIAIYAEPGEGSLRSCFEGGDRDDVYASFEVVEIEDKKVVLENIEMLLLDKNGEQRKQVSFERIEFARKQSADQG